MCGIVGVVDFTQKEINQKTLVNMTRTLSHRGPDDEGIFVDKNIGLGHRRLSIIDLSSAGHQPMFYDNQNLAIVYNGEVYNYIEIREELIKLGYKFKSQTDTEVILASYKEWGIDCLKKFNGMWAFVIYDKRHKLIFVARDRLGIKPVYYYRNKNKLIIASEIKAVLEDSEVLKKPNDRIIWDYLVTGWLDHTNETFFKNIFELRGGHYLVGDFNGTVKVTKYWDLEPDESHLPEKANISKFQELFEDSVSLRLRSDVSLGTCLSGGLDSSAIVMQINRFLKDIKISTVGKNQKTFSAIYGPNFPLCDEQVFIKEVVKKTLARSYSVVPQGKKLATEITKLVWHQDQPFSTTSIFAQWNVFRLAHSRHVKVMLDGQGADELLAGYTGYFGINFVSLLKKGRLIELLKELYYFRVKQKSFAKILREILGRALKAGWLGQKAAKLFWQNNSVYQVFKPPFLALKAAPTRVNFNGEYFKNSLYNSIKMNLPSLLRYEDRNSMAFSIESRVPFLDYRLVEFVFSLPNNYKIRNGETKWVMRQALKKLLPKKIATRQDKIGFATPEEIWLKNDLKEDLTNCFNSSVFASRGYADPEKVQKLYKKYLSGKIKDGGLFWRLYCLEIWFRVFID